MVEMLDNMVFYGFTLQRPGLGTVCRYKMTHYWVQSSQIVFVVLAAVLFPWHRKEKARLDLTGFRKRGWWVSGKVQAYRSPVQLKDQQDKSGCLLLSLCRSMRRKLWLFCFVSFLKLSHFITFLLLLFTPN